MRNSMRWSIRYNAFWVLPLGCAGRICVGIVPVALGLRPMKPLAAASTGARFARFWARPKPVTGEDASTTAGPVLTPSPDPQVTSVP